MEMVMTTARVTRAYQDFRELYAARAAFFLTADDAAAEELRSPGTAEASRRASRAIWTIRTTATPAPTPRAVA